MEENCGKLMTVEETDNLRRSKKKVKRQHRVGIDVSEDELGDMVED